MRREGHSHVWWKPVAGDKLHLVDSLLFAALVLEPDLDDPHGQPGLLGQLLSHLPRRLGVLVEAGLQHLQLLGLDGGAGATTLAVLSNLALSLVLVVVVVSRYVRGPGLTLHRHLVTRLAARVVQVKVGAGIVHGRRGAVHPHAVAVLDVVNLAEEVASVVAAHLVSLGEVGRAVPAGEAVSVEQLVADLPRLVRLGKHELAGGATGSEHAVKVLTAVKLAKFRETRFSQGRPTAGAL